MRSKKTALILLMMLTMLSLGAVTVDKGKSIGRYLGLELTKNSGNIFRVTSLPVIFPMDQNGMTTEDYRIWVLSQPASNLIHFDNVTSEQPPAPVSFQILYYFETPGTLFVFFSSQSDLGYKEGATSYDNPHMLKSIDGPHFINYNIDVQSWYSYGLTGADKSGTWQPVQVAEASNHGTQMLPSDYTIDSTKPTIIDICPYDAPENNPNGIVTPVKPLDPTISSGVVFRRKINEGGIRGADMYTLTIESPSGSSAKQSTTPDTKKMFSAGFYTGYVIVHFTVQ